MFRNLCLISLKGMRTWFKIFLQKFTVQHHTKKTVMVVSSTKISLRVYLDQDICKTRGGGGISVEKLLGERIDTIKVVVVFVVIRG